ncbi:MAG: potassium channel family protein [Gammaproteobacteria bacterium]|nr:potassium channel family protein [Gammaproteobacteria bacterium]NNC68206.1 two pore domain potassium channel family protein [Gammaproteobacteria bacterium]
MTLVFISTIMVIVLAVALHYEVLTHLAEKHFKRAWPSRLLLPVGVIIVIMTHVIEVWLFAFLYYFLLPLENTGEVIGEFSNTVLDCAYFSFVNYTSLGYGDIVPVGHIRFTAGSEALTGLVLIAWTASFTYLQMQQLVHYKNKK